MSLKSPPRAIDTIFGKLGLDWTADERHDVRVWLNTPPQLRELQAHCRTQLGYGASKEDAEDAWKDFDTDRLGPAVDKYDWRRMRFQGWLLMLVAQFCWRKGRECRNRGEEGLERNSSDGRAIQLDPEDPTAATETDLIKQLDSGRETLLLKCLDALNPRQKAVIKLTYFQETSETEMSDKWISEQLGINIGHVKVIRFRALRRLRNYVQQSGRHSV